MSWKKNFCGRDRHTTDDNAAALPAPRPDALPSGSGRRRRIVVGLLAIAVIGGCSSTDDFFKDQPPPPGGSQASFAERFRKLLGAEPPPAPPAPPAAPAAATAAAPDGTTPAESGTPSAATPGTPSASAAAPGAAPATPISVEAGKPLSNCPPVDIRRGASTLQMTAPGSDNAMAVRYQATFAQTARQCAEAGGNLVIKVGVQGRIILGPAGATGETKLPLRYALVKEGMEPQTLWSKLYLVSVTIPPDDPNISFTHVMEDMAVPMPPDKAYGNYVIYVGFDPKGAEQEKPKRRRGRR